ncbi:heat shock protein Hsp20 [Candidatus Nitrosoglobus terrae]|uniref:Heat shock protein Hsp20 n=1 Tax=Candidatus Nitrosoglobus terrae TaxID=1630141 RepID=A0A1Q2SLZ2_9GAMM|nr:Hsp20/alpha crystallin family protein [Candidatus Nitrosoglobus terrae]BAW80142.1 heat shock protein Hsp20 [Candidatus Nitrosoglobus terrae]
MTKYYEPLHTLGQLQREVNRLFDTSPVRHADEADLATSDWVPAVDIKEDTDRFIIYADLPGVEGKDIEITLDNSILTLKGHRESSKSEERQGYKRVERVSGTFLRRFTLPSSVDAAKVSARSQSGVLELVIPKNQQSQTRKITVEG